MIDPQTQIAAKAFLAKVSEGFPVTGALLFGSRARQTHTVESDADVAVFLPGKRGDFLATKLAMADIAFDNMLETGVLVQPLPIWEDEWEHPLAYSNPYLLANIRREGIRL